MAGRDLGGIVGDVQDGHSLEIALVGDAEVVGDDFGIPPAEDAYKLFRSPDEELALHALAVGVLGGVEASVGVAHFAQHVVQYSLRDPCIGRVPCGLVSVGVEAGEKRVVVQHLLEVGNQPEGVGGVAVEAAADLVVHAAGGHLVEGQVPASLTRGECLSCDRSGAGTQASGAEGT